MKPTPAFPPAPMPTVLLVAEAAPVSQRRRCTPLYEEDFLYLGLRPLLPRLKRMNRLEPTRRAKAGIPVVYVEWRKIVKTVSV